MKKRILYIMSIEWDWIYQRPQIIAEKLSQDYNVTVVCPRYIWQGKMPYQRTDSGLRSMPLWRLPYQERSGLLCMISKWLNRKITKMADEFDYIYIGYPLYERYIPEGYRGKIIYDCMDNYEALFPLKKYVEKVIQAEEKIVRKADMVLTSSEVLGKKVDQIAGATKSVLLRNALFLKNMSEIKPIEVKSVYEIGYVGTISGWLDLDLLKNSVAKNERIRYHLLGPYKERIESEKIIYHGPVEHDKLGEAVKGFDCLVMPFQLNEIVEAVDPVKLYEYISYGKCIVSVFYPEIERFSDFVYFYRTPEEYLELMEKLCLEGFPPKYQKEEQLDFLEENTWEQRYQV